MGLILRFRNLVTLLSVAGMGFVASAQPSGSAAELRSFEQMWAEAKGYSPPASVKIQWRELLYPDPQISEGDLSAMAQRVEGRPDHPERETLETERRRRSKGPDERVTTVWYGGPGYLRVNQDESWRPLYVDMTLTRKAHWAMVPSNLTVMSPDALPPGRDFRVIEGDVRRAMREFVYAGFGSGLEPMSAEHAGDRWSAQAGSEELSVQRWEGPLSQEAGRALPVRRMIVRAAERFAKEVGRQTEFEGWHYDAVLDAWVASKITERDPGGRVLKVLRLESVERVEESLLASVTQVPEADAADPVRGAPTFTTVMDYRSGVERVTMTTEQGVQESSMTASELGRNPSSRMRTIGWIVAGLIGAALVGMRIVRTRADPTRHA